MSVFMQPIFRFVTPSSFSGNIYFQNIPQTFTDLKLEISAAETNSGTGSDAVMFFDSSSNIYSTTYMGATYNQRQSNNGYILIGNVPQATATNIFSNTSVYIPNYTGSNYKQVIIDGTSESNTTTLELYINAGLYSSTSAITKINLGTAGGGGWAANSTITLYGILRQGI